MQVGFFRRRRNLILLAFFLLLCCGAWWYRTALRPPTSRLRPGETYPGAPETSHRHYLDLALDHSHPEFGTFRGYYVLSPHFDPGGPVIFLFTDGQMELDGPNPPFDFFEAELPALSYVIVGHRGHDPALFPEVYPAGRLDVHRAMELYGSWQQVEDIEDVRLDMIKRRLLQGDGKIHAFGASGAGVLVQQYLHRHPESVRRACLVSTGAPDVSRRMALPFSRDYRDLDSDAQALMEEAVRVGGVNRQDLSYVLYQLGREGVEGLAIGRKILHDAAAGSPWGYRREWFRFQKNRWVIRFLLNLPGADAVKVRMFELMGADLHRNAKAVSETNLLIEWSSGLLRDYENAGVQPPDLTLDRRRFSGEVLIVEGLQDIVFSPEVGEEIAREYPRSRFLAVRGGHRLEQDRPFHRALREAFFRHGLESPEFAAAMALASK